MCICLLEVVSWGILIEFIPQDRHRCLFYWSPNQVALQTMSVLCCFCQLEVWTCQTKTKSDVLVATKWFVGSVRSFSAKLCQTLPPNLLGSTNWPGIEGGNGSDRVYLSGGVLDCSSAQNCFFLCVEILSRIRIWIVCNQATHKASKTQVA